jgi:hypothetical protein
MYCYAAGMARSTSGISPQVQWGGMRVGAASMPASLESALLVTAQLRLPPAQHSIMLWLQE